MTKLRFSTLLILTVFGCLFASPVQADVDLQKAIRAIRDVGPHGGQVAPAALAWRRVAASDVRELCEILEGMDGANSLARNSTERVPSSTRGSLKMPTSSRLYHSTKPSRSHSRIFNLSPRRERKMKRLSLKGS